MEMTAHTNPDNITFGIEIECALPREVIYDRGIEIGRYHHPTPLPHPFPDGWRAERDGSLYFGDPDLAPVEITSPALSGLDGILQVKAVLDLLNHYGAKVNLTCGQHVHIGMPSVIGDKAGNFREVSRWVRKLLRAVSIHEPALYGITGEPGRLTSTYCKSIKAQWAGKLRSTDCSREWLQQMNRPVGKYASLNLNNLFLSKQTVEFRLFAGNLDPVRAVSYITAAIAICQWAAEQPSAPPYDASPFTGDYSKAVRKFQRAMKGYGWPTGAEFTFRTRVNADRRKRAANMDAGLALGPRPDAWHRPAA